MAWFSAAKEEAASPISRGECGQLKTRFHRNADKEN